MSRTYRRHEESKLIVHGHAKTWSDEQQAAKAVGAWTLGWHSSRYVNRRARDSKPWDKPPKVFKQIKRRKERARMNAALRQNLDLPVVHKTDRWEWV